VKLAFARHNRNGFAAGQMFFGVNNGPIQNTGPIQIGSISADGSTANLSFSTLTSESSLIRGGICVDESGSFGGKVIAVTTGGDIWTADSSGSATLLTTLTTIDGVGRIEGITTLPNDTRWGTQSGKIITGDELTGNIFTVDSHGNQLQFNQSDTGIFGTEDFDMIPPNKALYLCDGSPGVHKLASGMSGYQGRLLIPYEGNLLYVVRWNAAQNNFVVQDTFHLSFSPEAVTFAPIDLPTQ
jgi:hypothetical protein